MSTWVWFTTHSPVSKGPMRAIASCSAAAGGGPMYGFATPVSAGFMGAAAALRYDCSSRIRGRSAPQQRPGDGNRGKGLERDTAGEFEGRATYLRSQAQACLLTLPTP